MKLPLEHFLKEAERSVSHLDEQGRRAWAIYSYNTHPGFVDGYLELQAADSFYAHPIFAPELPGAMRFLPLVSRWRISIALHPAVSRLMIFLLGMVAGGFLVREFGG